MTSSEFIDFTNKVYDQALAGKRLMLTGDSFFISVIEKNLINKLANSSINDISLATYKPALNAHFFSGGQIVVVDFFSGARGLHQLQFVDNLDEIFVLENQQGSAKRLVDEHIVPMTVMFDKVSFNSMEA
jgi:hypothetical protein